MDTITVKKSDLLEVLRKNRESHRAEFEKALEGWHKTVLKTLEDSLADAKAGKWRQMLINLPRPEDHTTDYDRRIQMFEMDVNPTVELDEQEFATFVQDDWGWRRQWTLSNSVYVAAASDG